MDNDEITNTLIEEFGEDKVKDIMEKSKTTEVKKKRGRPKGSKNRRKKTA